MEITSSDLMYADKTYEILKEMWCKNKIKFNGNINICVFYVIVKYFYGLPLGQCKYVHINYSKWWYLFTLQGY